MDRVPGAEGGLFSGAQYDTAYPDGIEGHWWLRARSRIVAYKLSIHQSPCAKKCRPPPPPTRGKGRGPAALLPSPLVGEGPGMGGRGL